MNSKFEPLAVDPVRNRLKASPVDRGRKAVECRDEPPVGVEDEFLVFRLAREGIFEIPALIDDGILPPVLLHAGQYRCVGLEVRFIDGESVGVPAVPPHRRRGREGSWSGESEGKGRGHEQGNEKKRNSCQTRHTETY